MPYSPKKPCKYPNCPKLTNSTYCDEHTTLSNRQYEKYHRNPETSKRYGRKWRTIRNRYISANPLCEKCKESDRLVRAEEVHHILPLERGGTHDWSNLMSLCKSCHSTITAQDGDRWHKGVGG